MRVITHCPVCQTQFFATEEQLTKHGGKVRCGQCLHVFDANIQLVSVASDNDTFDSSTSLNDSTASIDVAELLEPAAQSISKEKSITNNTNTYTATESAHQQPAYLGDVRKRTRLSNNIIAKKFASHLWTFASVLLILVTVMQSMYFLRNEIAIYYPNLKPYLVQVCHKLSCSINLPRQIESIVIDDSDMQEDANYAGLVRFSSTLVNTGKYILAYPDIELTLTDIDDKPAIRRIFKPDEYLPADRASTDGLKAGEEIRIQLAVTTSNIVVSGYRVFVTY